MKKISALLISFIMLAQILVIMPSAAGNNEIVIEGGDCYTQSKTLERDTREGRNWIRIDSNQWVGYRVNFEKPTSILKLDYHTGATSRHILEVRLGSASGKLLGSFDTRLEATVTWGIFQHLFTFEEPLIGQQSIFIKGLGGNNWMCGLTFIADSDQTFDSYEENDNFNDIKDDKNRSKINLLSDLEIIPKTEKSFMPNYPVTRQEFVSMLGKVINADKYSMSESPFADVKNTDDNARFLTGLYQMGIIKGDTEENFRPHSFITTLEAATVCTNALGYKPFAEGMVDALEIADKLRIFNGVDMSKKEITYSDAAAIIYNLLLCDYLKVDAYSNNAVSYEPTKNYLEKNTEYKHGTGVVTSNKVTELFAAKKSSGITIDGEYFETGDVKGSYLGVLCDYFYIEEGDLKTLKAIRPAKKAKVTVVRSASNIKFDKITEREISYINLDDEEEYEFDVTVNTSIIYNGTALSGSLKSLIANPSDFTGTLTIIDNNGDGECECVWIDHVSAIVNVVANSNGQIKDKKTGKLFDMKGDSASLFIDGKPGLADQINIGDILYVYESSTTDENKMTRFTCNSTEISGIVTEKTTDGKVKINDEIYIISPVCPKSINVGLSGAFYVDEFSNIIGYEEETVSLNVGAFLGINLKNSLDFDMEVKLLTESGIKIFEVAKNVKYDGFMVKSKEDLYNGTEAYAGVKDLSVKTPVLYKTNDGGELKMIDTVNPGTYGEDDSLNKLSEAQSFRYLGDVLVNSSWQNCYPAPKDAVVLKLTSDNNEEHYSMQKGFADRETFTNNVTPYTMEKDSIIADVLVVMDHPAEVNYMAEAFVFEDINVELNGEGEPARYINGRTAASKVKHEIDEEKYSSDENFKKLIDSVKKGDLILPYLTRGKMASAELVYIPGALTENSAGVPTKIYDGVASYTGGLYYGTVTKLEDGFVQYELQGNGRLDSYACNGKVLVCEKEENGKYKITNELNSSAIFEGDRLIVRVSEYVVKAVYIYRGDRS